MRSIPIVFCLFLSISFASEIPAQNLLSNSDSIFFNQGLEMSRLQHRVPAIPQGFGENRDFNHRSVLAAEQKMRLNPALPFDMRNESPFAGFNLPTYQLSGGSGNVPADMWGRAITEDFLVNDDTSGGQNAHGSPAIARSPSGSFVVTWWDCRDNSYSIYAQLYDAFGTPIGNNFRVNEIVNTIAWEPAIAMDHSGNFVVVWTDWRNDPDRDIYAQRYDSAGTPLGANFKVNDDIGSMQARPAVAEDISGNFVITWTLCQDGLNVFDIYGQRYDSVGTRLGTNFKVNDDVGSAWQDDPAIAMNGTGNFVITWGDSRNNGWGIYAQMYEPDGTPLNTNYLVSNSVLEPVDFDGVLAVGMDREGDFVITWYDSLENILAQRYTSLGLAVDTNFQVNDDTIPPYIEGLPDIAMDSSGKFVITWASFNLPITHGVYAQRFDSSGNRLAGNFMVSETQGTAHFPAIASDYVGNFVVTWVDLRFGQDHPHIYAQMYNSAGGPLGTNFRVCDDFGVADQWYPEIAANGSGRFAVVWLDYRDFGDIYAQIYDSTAVAIADNFKVNDTLEGIWGVNWPAIDINAIGDFVVTWQDDRNGNLDIYAQMYQSDGTPLGPNFKVNNATDTADQAWPHVAITGNRGFVITFSDTLAQKGEQNILAQRFDPAGNPLGVNFWVGSGYYSTVAADHHGNFVIVWDNRNPHVWDIFAQRYDSLGTPMGPTFKVNDDAGNHAQWYPDIAMDCSGNFIITFSDMRNGFYEVYAQRYDSTGARLGSNFKVFDGTGYGARVAMDCSGSFVVTWIDNNILDVYGRRFNSSGTPSGDIFQIPNPDYVSFAQTQPAVAASNYNFYFAWQDNRRSKGWDIYSNIKGFHPPGVFSLLSPKNKAFTPRVVCFDWDDAVDPYPLDQVRYDLYISTSYHAFMDSATIDSNLTLSKLTKTLDWGSYYWKVKAKDNYGGETWCNQMGYFMVTGFHPYPIGDFDPDSLINVGDVVFAINYLYKSGPAPDPLEVGDCNCDEGVDVGDVVYLINYLFKGGPEPICQ